MLPWPALSIANVALDLADGGLDDKTLARATQQLVAFAHWIDAVERYESERRTATGR